MYFKPDLGLFQMHMKYMWNGNVNEIALISSFANVKSGISYREQKSASRNWFTFTNQLASHSDH